MTDPFADQNEWADQPEASPAAGVRSVYVTATAGDKVGGELITETRGETFEFLAPVSPEAATAARDELHARLQAEVDERVAARVAARKEQLGSQAQVPPLASYHPVPPVNVAAPTQQVHGVGAAAVAAVGAGTAVPGGGWRVGQNPRGGEVRYIGSDVISKEQFVFQMEQAWVAQGMPAHLVKFWDNRGGDRGLEAGGKSFFVGAIKLNDTAPGYAALGKKVTVGMAEFAPDGSVRVRVSPEYQQLITTLQSAGVDPFAG